MTDPTAPAAPKLSAGIILTLIEQVGAPLAMELVDLFFRNGEVTAETWTTLRTKIRTPFDTLVPQRPGTAG